MEKSIYDYTVTSLDGEKVNLSSYKGKKIIIVNTASECGLTPQYAKLQTLYEQYKDKGLVIIGFPSNDFGGQEPGTNEQIGMFCSKNYGVTFPMMSKITVTGAKKADVYEFLTSKSLNGLQDSTVEWNFQKYLINEQGKLVKVVSPKVDPDDAEIVDWVKS